MSKTASVLALGTLRSDEGGCLRRRAEVANICLRISGSRRVRFPALALLSENCLPSCLKRE